MTSNYNMVLKKTESWNQSSTSRISYRKSFGNKWNILKLKYRKKINMQFTMIAINKWIQIICTNIKRANDSNNNNKTTTHSHTFKIATKGAHNSVLIAMEMIINKPQHFYLWFKNCTDGVSMNATSNKVYWLVRRGVKK